MIASAAGALVLETRFAAKEWGPFAWLTPLAVVAAWILTRRSVRIGYATVFGVAYVYPVLFQATRGRFLLTDQVVWLATLLGTVIACSDWRGWAFPDRWKIPLVYWALVVGLVWPVVVYREADFHWFTMAGVVHIPNSGLGSPPPAVAVMVLNVSLTYLLGILTFDSFFHTFAGRNRDAFRCFVVPPLVVSFLLGAALSQYQAFVNLAWLSDHQWPVTGRAAGGLLDGDASGALAGFWTAPAWALAGLNPAGFGVGAAAMAIAWAVIWASGSRMALVAGAIGTIGAGISAARMKRARLPVLAAVIICVTVGFAVLRHGYGSIDDPLHRALGSMPSLTRQSLTQFARVELFDRHAPYGSASVAMLKRFPVTGVGVGTFYFLFPDYAFVIADVRSPYDNAQSWYRHQFAELGLVGSVGWVWWVVGLAWLLITTRGENAHRFHAGVLKAALVAIATVSMVSMPTQVIPVSLTVWVFVFWYLTLSTDPPARVPWGRWLRQPLPWILIWATALSFVAASYWVGRTQLRPPFRAVFADWDYYRGWYPVETRADGLSFRWTAEDEAVAVFPARGRYVKLTFWVSHPDVAERPVDVTFSGQRGAIGSVRLHDSSPVTWYVRVPVLPVAPAGFARMMIQTDVSRTWRPSAYGKDDPRTLGVAIADWTIVDQPPRGATVLK